MLTRKIVNKIVYKEDFTKDIPMATTDYSVNTYLFGIRIYSHNFKEDISSTTGKAIPKQSMGFGTTNKKT